MEINLIEEDAKIEEIEGYKTLKYTVKDNGKSVDMDNFSAVAVWIKK